MLTDDCSDFDNFFLIGKISASWCSRSKKILNPHVLNLSFCLFNILFGYNFHKNKSMTRKFLYVFELLRFAFHMKNCYCNVHRSFYRVLQKFQYINIFCSFLMIQIGTKFRYVFKLRTSDLHTRIGHHNQHIFFLQGTLKMSIH